MSEKGRGDNESVLRICTVCDYSTEGDPPEKCPECGANKSEFEEVPKPGY